MTADHYTAHVTVKQVTFEEVPGPNSMGVRSTSTKVKERRVDDVLEVTVRAESLAELTKKVTTVMGTA